MKYNVTGEPFSVVICDLEPGETVMCEAGAMSWMSPNMKMETTTNGGIGKALGRMFSGEAFEAKKPEFENANSERKEPEFYL